MPAMRRLRCAALILALVAPASSWAQTDADRVAALVRALKDPDFDTASAAVSELRKYPQERARVVAGLVDAVRTGEWRRCGGDMRDAIAHLLGEVKAKEAVEPLLEVVRSGKAIEHECSQ